MRRTSKRIDRWSPRRASRLGMWPSIFVLILLLSPASCSGGSDGNTRGGDRAAVSAPVVTDELVRVKRVFDGDTILLEDGRTVRYLSINTPEFQEPFYLKAKRLNESLVLGREIRLEFDQEKSDGHDRLLAYVYAGGEMVNGKLVREGLAHAFFIGPNRRHHALFLRLQAEAQQRKIGIWSARGRAKDLKITNVNPADPKTRDQSHSYVRITNLGHAAIRLAGYTLSSEEGQSYLFPDVSVDPGHTVIVAGEGGTNGVDIRGQLVVHWPTQDSVWNPAEDTAFLKDPAGILVDTFHYKGRRVRKSPSRRSNSQRSP